METKGKIILAAVCVTLGIAAASLGTLFYLKSSPEDTTPASKKILTPEEAVATSFTRGLNNLDSENNLDFYFEPNEINEITNYFIKEQLNSDFSVVPYSFEENGYLVKNFYFETISRNLQAVAVFEKGNTKAVARSNATFNIDNTKVEIKILGDWKQGRGNFNSSFSPKLNIAFDYSISSVKDIMRNSSSVEKYLKNVRWGAKVNISEYQDVSERNEYAKTYNSVNFSNKIVNSYNWREQTVTLELSDLNGLLQNVYYPTVAFDETTKIEEKNISFKSNSIFWNAHFENGSAGTLELKTTVGKLDTYLELDTELVINEYGLRLTVSGPGKMNGLDAGTFPFDSFKSKIGSSIFLTYNFISPTLNEYTITGGKIFGGELLLNAVKK